MTTSPHQPPHRGGGGTMPRGTGTQDGERQHSTAVPTAASLNTRTAVPHPRLGDVGTRSGPQGPVSTPPATRTAGRICTCNCSAVRGSDTST